MNYNPSNAATSVAAVSEVSEHFTMFVRHFSSSYALLLISRFTVDKQNVSLTLQSFFLP